MKGWIEVKEFDPGVGNEYLSINYPHSGIFYIQRLGCIYAVDKSANTVMTWQQSMNGLVQESRDQTVHHIGIQFEDVMRAMALVLNPKDAEKYVKKP